jgi:NDP-4-keto-2,6-dideoxyhexose 3-C-methyltransferase
MYTTIKNCRLCGNQNLIEVFNLGDQTLTGVFPKSKSQLVTRGPVQLVKCHGSSCCGLLQLKQSYNLAEMYGDNYGYRSGLNSSMVKHLTAKIDAILKKGILVDGDLVIDIGSNDATSLKAYPQGKYKLVGIDPSAGKFRGFYTGGITLIEDFFSASKIKELMGNVKAKVITSFSMFYDLENPLLFALEIAEILDEQGVWIFEQSYLPSMLETNSFDTVCQEHLEYYSISQIQWIADKAGLKIVDIQMNDVNGGSFSITAAKKNSLIEVSESNVNDLKAIELNKKLDSLQIYESFKNSVENAKSEFLVFIQQCQKTGKSVYGIGASTKGNVLLQYYGLDSSMITAIGEVNEDKFGAYTPWSLIPIIPEEEVLGYKPDYLVVLPWHFKNFFINSIKFKGITLVFPLPNLHFVKL